MKTPIRLATFAAVLAVVLGGAVVAGGAIEPGRIGGEEATSEEHGGDEMTTMSDEHGATTARHGEEAPAGLAVADAGYRLELDRTTFPAGRERTLRFRILDEAGRPVEDFDEEHTKRLHLIVVRRDLTGYQHLHPDLTADGTWRVPLRLADPGAYRVFADFTTGGESLTLGADLLVPGDFRPRPLPAPSTVASTAGYDVRLDSGEAGLTRFTVSRGGEPVDDLQPYLGARGHLVILREGDLAYLHVHPEEPPAGDPAIAFHAELPTAGRYRMFLQFRHGDEVRTAAFTQEVDR